MYKKRNPKLSSIQGCVGAIQFEFLSVNAKFTTDILSAIRVFKLYFKGKKKLNLISRKSTLFLNIYTQSHWTNITLEQKILWSEKKILDPPHSPDFASSSYYFLWSLQNLFKFGFFV